MLRSPIIPFKRNVPTAAARRPVGHGKPSGIVHAGADWTAGCHAPDPVRSTQLEHPMSDRVYKVVELVGSSTDSIKDAIQTAIKRADQTLRNLRWFEVVQTRGYVENGEVRHYQVVLKAGFTLEAGGA